jgi:hypothetical protein
MKLLLTIWGLVDVTTKYYVTSSNWGEIIAELDAQYVDQMMDPTKPAPWKLHPNIPMKFGVKPPFLYVINSGTEDQRVCNVLNNDEPLSALFGAKRDRLRTG